MRSKTSTLTIICCLAMIVSPAAWAQQSGPDQDSTVNNLVHAAGYETGKWGELGPIRKRGTGRQNLILIPGWGFDASVFGDFMDANRKKYRMYAITIPGYGGTAAPPMPPAGTSYGEQNWNKGVIQGLVDLIDREKLDKPIVVGHFTQGTQIALRMAKDHPDKVGGVIIMGGPAKFIVVMKGESREFTVDQMISYTDRYTGPVWFKHMVKKYFDDNNYAPGLYSVDSTVGASLWTRAANVPLPVMVQYLCEFFASDIKVDLARLTCPVLVLRAAFTESFLRDPVNNYVGPQFIDTWNDVSTLNSRILVKDISGAATFLWKDKPDEVYHEMDQFLKSVN